MEHNLTEEELKMLNAVKTEDGWNAACDAVKKARKGNYPPDWFEKVIQTRLIEKVLGEDAGYARLSTFDDDGNLREVAKFRMG